VAKFLKKSILTAKKGKTRYVYVTGCLHIIECLFSQEKLPMQLDEPAFKRLKKEPKSTLALSSEQVMNDQDYDEEDEEVADNEVELDK
ncbi:hypothetical protein MKX01_002083, partial [Papaver californicum]